MYIVHVNYLHVCMRYIRIMDQVWAVGTPTTLKKHGIQYWPLLNWRSFLFVCYKIPILFQVKKNTSDLYGEMIASLAATIASLEVWPYL